MLFHVTTAAASDLVCFSHLRWNFVFQRPQHLMTRFAAHRRVFYVEEPLPDESGARLALQRDRRVTVVVPHVSPADLASPPALTRRLRQLLDQLFAEQRIGEAMVPGRHSFVAWYTTPMALPWTNHLAPEVTVYDCMDDLSAFKGAPPEMAARE